MTFSKLIFKNWIQNLLWWLFVKFCVTFFSKKEIKKDPCTIVIFRKKKKSKRIVKVSTWILVWTVKLVSRTFVASSKIIYFQRQKNLSDNINKNNHVITSRSINKKNHVRVRSIKKWKNISKRIIAICHQRFTTNQTNIF